MNKQLSALMQKEVTRKEFLAMLGLGIATILGFHDDGSTTASTVLDPCAICTGAGATRRNIDVYGGRRRKGDIGGLAVFAAAAACCRTGVSRSRRRGAITAGTDALNGIICTVPI